MSEAIVWAVHDDVEIAFSKITEASNISSSDS